MKPAPTATSRNPYDDCGFPYPSYKKIKVMTKTKVLDEVKAITAEQVAKKQDAAKVNFPKIIEKIKEQAALGNSECILSLSEMNEFDKKLLEAEGFFVHLREKERDYWSEQGIRQYQKLINKEWRITW